MTIRKFIFDKSQPIFGDILEVGTGKGHFALILAQEGCYFTSVDISEEEQKFANFLEGIFFVAAVTNVIASRHQHGRGLRTMGVMALRTLARLQRRMNVLPVQTGLGRSVAFQADLVAVFLEQQLGHPSMPEVAVLTFFLLDDRKQILLRKILRFKFCVAVQTLLAGHFFCGMAVRSDPGEHTAKDQQHDQRNSPDPHFIECVHGFSC